MDILRDIFRSIRLEGSVFFDSALSAPWDLKVEPSNRPRFHLVVEGFTWVQCSSFRAPICLRAGHVLFMNDGRSHSLADQPISEPRERTDVPPIKAVLPPKCRLICGTFGFDGQMRHPLIDTLPAQIQFSISEEQRSLWAMVRMMADELDNAQAGSTVVVDRLCELLLIYILRSHASANPDMPGFVAAQSDSVTRNGLLLIHERPDENWTVGSLAQASGLSRSAFAARFHQLVGIPPLTYLTTWRMHKAKSLLQNRSARVSVVARQVGYSSDTAFTRAFKQFFDESPGSFRAKARFQR